MAQWKRAGVAAAILVAGTTHAAAGELQFIPGPVAVVGVPVVVTPSGPLFMSMPGPIVVAQPFPGPAPEVVVVPNPYGPPVDPLGCYEVNALLICP